MNMNMYMPMYMCMYMSPKTSVILICSDTNPTSGVRIRAQPLVYRTTCLLLL